MKADHQYASVQSTYNTCDVASLLCYVPLPRLANATQNSSDSAQVGIKPLKALYF